MAASCGGYVDARLGFLAASGRLANGVEETANRGEETIANETEERRC